MQRPTASPTIPASPSGVSNTRCSPNRRCRSSVTRKTPPCRPTSSPKTRTRGSSASDSASASFSACCIERSDMDAFPLRDPRVEARLVRSRGALVSELQAVGQAGARGLGEFASGLLAGRRRLGLDRGQKLLVGLAALAQELTSADDRVPLAPAFLLLDVAIARRVVRGGMGTGPVGHRLDHGGAAAVAGTFERGRGRLADGDDIVAVDPVGGEAVAGRTGRDRAAGDLADRGERDRPTVVLTEEDNRQLEDAGEVHRLVDLTLGAGAVAEVGDGDAADAVELGPHRPAG